MDIGRFERTSASAWTLKATGRMRVPVVIFASAELLRAMDEQVLVQARNVAALPGIVKASFVMPDGHWGYGFPIGGVAAFDADQGGVISAGGVGFDISCGVRCLVTGLVEQEIARAKHELASALFRHIPAGVGSTSTIRLDDVELSAMLRGGARWAAQRGFGSEADLERIEERGVAAGAEPDLVSARARERQRQEMGTLGSGNHYLEVQRVAELFDAQASAALGLVKGGVVVSIHCGSRGLGHQIGAEYQREMAEQASDHGVELPELELACAPIASRLGRAYLGAMRAGTNCALANRQILTHLVREVFADLFPRARLDLVYDVSHNTCKQEEHVVGAEKRTLFVHRKGATRAFGPGHPDLPPALSPVGQPVFVGGTMGTESFVLAGTSDGMGLAFGSACHGAGRAMSRHAALRRWHSRTLVHELAERGVVVLGSSPRGIAEEAPGAYKDVGAVVDVAHRAGIARKVARLEPLICIKG